MIALSMGAIRHVAVNENVVCANDLHLAACLTRNSRLLHRGDLLHSVGIHGTFKYLLLPTDTPFSS